MPPVRIALLGPIRIEAEAGNVRLSAPPMTFPLLGYLLLNRAKTVSREALAFTLWSDYDEPEAKLNLRRHLYHLARLLPRAPDGAPWLIVDAKTVRWNADSPATFDVAEFEESLRRGDRAAAASFYAGDLLEEYEAEWILPERERLRGLHVDNLLALISGARTERRAQEAMDYARQLQRCDPWREDALRECVSLRYELGDGAGAIAELDTFAKRLREELDAEMMPETVALRDMIAREQRRRGTGAPIALRDRALPWRTLPFVGRARELDVLQRAWERTLAGSGASVFVSGEAGIGKSRLVGAARTMAAGQGGLVLQGTAAVNGTPYQPLLEALAPAAAAIAQSPLAPIWGAALAAVLPELRAHRPDLPDLPPLPPERDQARLYEAFVRALAALSETRPLLLVIEDIHRSGPATLGVLEALAREAPAHAYVVLVTYRSEDVARGDPLRLMSENLRRTRLTQRVALAPLSAEDVDDLFRLLAGVDVETDQVASLLYRRSDGNPFFLGELLRDGIERGVLRLDDERVVYDAGSELRVSSGVREVMKARLQRISAESRTMLELAAVIGRSFTFEILREAAAVTDASAIRALLELADRQLVAESAEGNQYTFLHELLQSTAYELIPPEERRWHHLRVAEATEAAYASALDDAAARLAFHFERSGEVPRAAAYHLRAAQNALRLNANQEALHHCDRALALAAERAARTETLFVREEIHRRRAEHDACRADLDELAALDDNADANFGLEVLRRRIAIAHVTGDRDLEATLIAEMRERAEARESHKWTAVAYHADGKRFIARGQIEAARTALELALGTSEFADDPSSGEAYYDLILLGFHSGDRAAAERDLERGLAAARRLRNVELELRIASARMRFPHRFESPEQTYRLARELLRHAIAIGDLYETTEARFLAGTAAMSMFRIAEADEHLRIAEDLSNATTPKWRSTIASLRGILAFAVGDFESALAHFEASKALAVVSADRYTEFLCELNAASAFVMAGDAQRAIEVLASAEALRAEVGSALFDAVVRCIRGAALCRLGIPAGFADLEAGIAVQREMKRSATLGNDLAELTIAYVERCDAAAALEIAREMVPLSETAYGGAAHPEFMLWAAARAFELAGDSERTHEARARAYAWYVKHDEQIEDPRLKQCFAAMSFNRSLISWAAARTFR
jgi:DNA-binding SARP family transcriptional activator